MKGLSGGREGGRGGTGDGAPRTGDDGLRIRDGGPSPSRGVHLQIKICGVTRPEDARLAEAAGADRIGAVLVADTPRVIDERRARELADAIDIPLVLVVADLSPDATARAADRAGAAVLQLHGDEPEAHVRALAALGHWEIWKSARVRDGADLLALAARWEGIADGLLLDGWHPSRIGGTGVPFPWDTLEELRARWPAGLKLGAAGGLRPENVAEAVDRLRPDLVDVSSGVETSPGIKDPALVRAFVEAARAREAA